MGDIKNMWMFRGDGFHLVALTVFTILVALALSGTDSVSSERDQVPLAGRQQACDCSKREPFTANM